MTDIAKKVGKLIILRGLPGSGKSTWAKQLQEKTGCSHYENDMFFMQNGKYAFDERKYKQATQWCFQQTMKDLTEGKNVVVSNVFVTVNSVNQYLRRAKQLGAEVKVFRKISQYKNIHSVPLDVLASMKKNFQDYPGEILIK